MSNPVEELTGIQTQLEFKRKIILGSMSTTTVIVLVVYWIVAFSVWFLSEPNVSLFTLWMDEEYYLLVPSGIALFICMLLGVTHYYWLRYYWERQYKQAQAIIKAESSFSGDYYTNKLLEPVYKTQRQEGWGTTYLRAEPDEMLDRIELNGAFLIMLVSESKSNSDWKQKVLNLAHLDFLASRIGNTFIKLHCWMTSIPTWVWICCAPLLALPAFFIVLWLSIIYPFILPGGCPYMRRNACAQAIAKCLLEEQVKAV